MIYVMFVGTNYDIEHTIHDLGYACGKIVGGFDVMVEDMEEAEQVAAAVKSKVEDVDISYQWG